MPTVELTDEQFRRLETLIEELSTAHAGAYATVETGDAIEYLLDLAEAVEDPDREAAPTDGAFPEPAVRTTLEARHRRSDSDDGEMDLYTIAAAFEISGRSSMTKAELIDAIVEQAQARFEDPFVDVDVPFPPGQPDQTDDDTTSQPTAQPDTASQSTQQGEESGPQLDAMLNLLETHEEKWTEADGDARYEVTLPDGSTETARTKDDIRALLFKHY